MWLHPKLWRLDLGVFVLHTVQMSMCVVVPELLVGAGLPKAHHWQLYLPAVLASFVLMGGLFALERRGYMRAVLRGGIALLLLVQLALLWLAPQAPGLWTMGGVMLGYCSIGRLSRESVPTITVMIAMTMATMGRLTKKFPIPAYFSSGGLAAMSFTTGLTTAPSRTICRPS